MAPFLQTDHSILPQTKIKMKSYIIILLMSLAPILSKAQKGQAEIEKTVAQFLAQDCYVGEEKGMFADLKADAAAAQPLLINAIKQGPGKEASAKQKAYLGRRYAARQRLLENRKAGDVYPAGYLKSAKAESEADYVEKGFAQYVLRYKQQGIAGLGLVAGEEGRQFLQGIADGPKQSGLARQAQLSLQSPN